MIIMIKLMMIMMTKMMTIAKIQIEKVPAHCSQDPSELSGLREVSALCQMMSTHHYHHHHPSHHHTPSHHHFHWYCLFCNFRNLWCYGLSLNVHRTVVKQRWAHRVDFSDFSHISHFYTSDFLFISRRINFQTDCRKVPVWSVLGARPCSLPGGCSLCPNTLV